MNIILTGSSIIRIFATLTLIFVHTCNIFTANPQDFLLTDLRFIFVQLHTSQFIGAFHRYDDYWYSIAEKDR